MSGSRHFKDLIVWRKAMDLARKVYEVTTKFPTDERFGLISQMRRCAVSIPSNIAEGQARGSAGEFKHFLGIARGSLAELETQSQLAEELGMLAETPHAEVNSSIQEVGRMLNGLINSLSTSH
jgi:four helix bundle protein